MLTETLLFVAIALMARWLRRRWISFQIFKQLSIPGPKPNFFWGNYLELRKNHVVYFEKMQELYGETFGVFWGDKPFIVTSNLDTVKQVTISQFSNFSNRATQFVLENTHPTMKHMITFARDDEWKQLRRLQTPVFSNVKLRNLTPLIERSIDAFLSSLGKFSDDSRAFDIYPLAKRFSIDNTLRTLFGVDVNTQENTESDSELLKASLKFVEASMTGLLDVLCNSFTNINLALSVFFGILFKSKLLTHPVDNINREVRNIIDFRRTVPPRNDLMQTLLDSQKVNMEDEITEMTNDWTGDAKESVSKSSNFQMSNEQVAANAIILFVAGYETTSSAISLTLYLLAKHRDIQNRLREEIVNALKEKPFSYDLVTSLPFLDCVVREALRMYPPATGFSTREAKTSTEINGITIPAGMNILFPTKQIHMNSTFWKNPSTFDPDRFSQQDFHPQAWQPFGSGPRNCIGMKLALTVIKLNICRVIPQFEFYTDEDLKFKTANILSQPCAVKLTVKRIKT